MNKLISIIYGLYLMILNYRILNLNFLKGKRIVIVGPADSAFNTNLGDYIDDFDYIVRVNRSPYLLLDEENKKHLGSRTDILFHSFYENDESGGGLLDLRLYQDQKLKYLINPRNSKLGKKNTLVFFKKYLISFRVYTIPSKIHKYISRFTHPFRPTIGFIALMTILRAEFSELYITGFTFYKTDFGDGYRNHIKEKDKAIEFINQMGIHNIELEYQTFKQELKRHKSKNILLDFKLSQILN